MACSSFITIYPLQFSRMCKNIEEYSNNTHRMRAINSEYKK